MKVYVLWKIETCSPERDIINIYKNKRAAYLAMITYRESEKLIYIEYVVEKFELK